MRKFLPLLVDLSSGLLFVVVAFAGARVLLGSPRLVYLCFPLLAGTALAVGLWRGSRHALPLVLLGVVTTIPLLIMTLYFFSGRNKPFIVFPAVTFVFVCLGAALARRGATRWTATAVVVIAGVGGAFAGPRFVRLIVPRGDVNERAVPFT